MSYSARTIIAVAKSQIGYLEKASNKQLDIYEANAGSGNWTKYARDLYAKGYYNGNKNGFAWCAITVAWEHLMAANGDKTEAERVTCQTGKYGAVCTYAANYYKAQGRFDMEPRVGDQIFFKQAGSSGSSHTGTVVALDDTYVYTVEGNASNRVKECKYKRTYAYFYGFGHPLYGDDFDIEDATRFDLQKGAKGEYVTYLQERLKAKSMDVGEIDGVFGTQTLAAVKAFQKGNGLTEDGIVGTATWKLLLTGTSTTAVAEETKVEEAKVEETKVEEKVETTATTTTESVVRNIIKGDLVKISDDAVYWSGKKVPAWVRKLNWYVECVNSKTGRAVINKSKNGKYSIMSPINVKYLTLIEE